ncbi:hypothetical protein [Olsenella sp. An290]|uniref:Mu transposase domain-containing protein n=1 Tax=Olsenella sp. An290 TaxID=1965625 RepID=UPI00194FD9A0|nr:hypothetical protein [Olsenella sp. An290]
MENAVGCLRRNLLVPVPRVGSLAELNALLAEGRARLNAAAGRRDGRASAEALREDLAEMRALPGAAFDAVRWARARADKRGYVEVDGREHVAGPVWHGRELLVGVRPDSVEIVADRGRRVAVLPRAYGAGPAVRNPLSLVPAIVARPRALGGSTIRRDMPEGPAAGIGRMDAAGRRQTLGSIARASAAPGFGAARGAALRVVEGGRVPDDATVDVLARRIASGALGGEGGADPSVYDGFPRGAGPMPAGGELARRVVEAGGRCSLTASVLGEWASAGSPKQVEHLARHLEAEAASRDASKRASLLRRCGLPAPKTFDGYDWSAVSWPEGLGRGDPLCLVKSHLRKRARPSFGFQHASFSVSGAGTPLAS